MSRQRLPQLAAADRAVTRKQSELIDLLLTTGKSIAECAEILGRAPTNLYRDLKKPHVKKELQARTLEHMGILAPYAAHTQQQLLRAESEHVRASVAENILDRYLGKPIVRSQVALQGQIHATIDLS